jgi:mono/diheme cytochrome c family protein
MRPTIRLTLFLLTLLLLAACGRKPLQFPIERTASRLARGNYLVNSVAQCFGCHTEDTPDGDRAGLPRAGLEGSGSVFKVDALHLSVSIPNITPDSETGLGAVSDQDLFRAITQGIGHAMMPYKYFHEMADEDLASIIVYIRTLPAKRNQLPKSEIPPMLANAYKPLDPRPANFTADLSTPPKRGAYLANTAHCVGCHTAFDMATLGPKAGVEFGGGEVFDTPKGPVASANLTPDPSGISYYDERMFLEVIRTGANGARKLSTQMPWKTFRNMTDADLRDIFAFLRTLKPVQHRTDNTEAFTPCKKCGNRHGLGADN